MTRIEILVPPAKLDEIREALADVGIDGMTLSEVKIVELRSRRRSVYRGSTYIVDFTSKVKMELEVRDGLVARVVEVLRASLGTAEAEKAKVLLFDVVELKRIAAGDRADSRLGSDATRA
jgi:nitrogen regulatory protein P-II 2